MIVWLYLKLAYVTTLLWFNDCKIARLQRRLRLVKARQRAFEPDL